jgi:hypothetical protein
VSDTEEIVELKRRMHAMEQNMIRLATLIALINGVPQDMIDAAIIDEQAKMMREKGEL